MFLHRCYAAMALLAAMFAAGPAHAEPLYKAAFLPVENFSPLAMNNAGQIVGLGYRDDGSTYAAMFTGGVLRDLGLDPASYNVANAINDAGAVAGTTVSSNGVSHAFLYQNGAYTSIGTDTSGRGINARGDVVGGIGTDQGTFGYVYSGGILTQLPNIGTGRQGVATAINDRGDVTGFSTTDITSSPPPFHPYVYRGGALFDLGDVGGREVNMAVAINNAGQVAGYSESRTDAHAFLYDGGVLQDLGSFGGRTLSVADLNEHGTLVGTANTADQGYVPFMNVGHALVDLNTLVDPALGWLLLQAYANNDLGQIIGYGCQGAACGLVFLDLASPVPEPGASLMLLAGLLVVVGATRQRPKGGRKKPAVPCG